MRWIGHVLLNYDENLSAQIIIIVILSHSAHTINNSNV